MKANGSSPLRAGVLFLALASIGSTGCLTMALFDKGDHMKSNWEAEAAWRHRVADLKRAAATGDPKAHIELVEELASGDNDSESGKRELKNALALLTQSAEQDDGPAQRLLGIYLIDVRVPGFRSIQRDLRDHERGIYWLQRAATHGCRFKERGGSVGSDPALDVAKVMAASGRREEAVAWNTRSAIECGTDSPYSMLTTLRAKSGDRGAYVDWLALILLSQDESTIDKAKRSAPAADVSAAEQLAQSVRPRLAAIQREFPRRTQAAAPAAVPTSK